ncbi:hypothetical protein ASG90_14670 [Nocardioides sp. Soil797]|nr:hypothetical protein ASG90_14670 [Nocardioides sp. Soil797]
MAEDTNVSASDDTTAAARPVSDQRVLFDAPWVVEEGVWYIGPAEDGPDFEVPHDPRAYVTGLLDTADPRYLVVHGPTLYGKYRVRLELHADRPSVPNWCEDIVEVPLKVEGRTLGMGSFETFAKPLTVPVGEYRVRYCVTGLDTAAQETAEDEFEGDDYKLYTGRHLFQFWQAPHQPAEVVRIGSNFAASQVEIMMKPPRQNVIGARVG